MDQLFAARFLPSRTAEGEAYLGHSGPMSEGEEEWIAAFKASVWQQHLSLRPAFLEPKQVTWLNPTSVQQEVEAHPASTWNVF